MSIDAQQQLANMLQQYITNQIPDIDISYSKIIIGSE